MVSGLVDSVATRAAKDLVSACLPSVLSVSFNHTLNPPGSPELLTDWPLSRGQGNVRPDWLKPMAADTDIDHSEPTWGAGSAPTS